MKTNYKMPQLYFRIVLGFGFLLPVADRVGWVGPPGAPNVSWGNWDHFVTYTNVLMPFLGRSAASFMGMLASIAEVFIGFAFLIGYQIRFSAICGFLLTLSFAVCMGLFMGYRSPFSYSVFADSAGCLLLYTIMYYPYSIDNYLAEKNNY
nr:hypothetical protein [Mucilaginibacter sp. L294]